VPYLNVKTKEQLKQWMHTFTKQAIKVQTNVVCMPESLWQLFSGTGQESSADGGIHATRDHNNVRSVLRIAKY
jgi:hypothetical protein